MNLQNIECVRNRLQQNIDSQQSSKERNKLGQFATPTELALEIMREVLTLRKAHNISEPITFLEPALGTGSFYSALLKYHSPDAIALATGLEVDSNIAHVASELWTGFHLTVINEDFCRWNSSQENRCRYNLLVTNPPYVRHHHLTKDTKQAYSQIVLNETGLPMSRLSGLYAYFILFAHKYLAPNAISAWLIPSESMDVNYGTVLKRYLTEQVTLLRIHKYDPEDPKFSDALVSSSVVMFQNKKPSEMDVATLSYGAHIDSPVRTRLATLGTLQTLNKWSVYFAKTSMTVPSHNVPMLSDLFVIQRGIATGNNEFFIHSRDSALSQGFPMECLYPILPPPRDLRNNVVDAREDGFPLLDNPLVVIDTDLPMETLSEKYPQLWEYLKDGIQSHIPEAYLLQHRKLWYKQENRPPAPFLCTYMGRESSKKSSFRFILNKSKALATNGYLLLYPNAELSALIQSDPNMAEMILEALNRIHPEDFAREGREYGGGLKKIEPKELGKLPSTSLFERIPALQHPIAPSKLLV